MKIRRPSPGQLCKPHGMGVSKQTVSRKKFVPGCRDENKMYTCTKCPPGTKHKGKKMENALNYVKNELDVATDGESSQCNKKRIKNTLKLLADVLEAAPYESMIRYKKDLDGVFKKIDGLIPFLNSVVQLRDLARTAADLQRVYFVVYR